MVFVLGVFIIRWKKKKFSFVLELFMDSCGEIIFIVYFFSLDGCLVLLIICF